MKKILIPVLFCFFLLPIVTNAEIINYKNPQYHYSFTIPNTWIEIPKSIIDEVMQQLVNMSGGESIDYTAGFQLENNELFQYPYILVQQYEIDTPSYNQITETFKSNEFSNNINKSIDEYSKLISNASLEDPFIDRDRNIIFMNSEMDVVDIGKVKGLMAAFLGKDGITQLNFYSGEFEYLENLSTFNQIIDSFKYDQGYEYSQQQALQNDNSNIFEGVMEKGIIGLITGGIFALLFWLFSGFKKEQDE
ncbi:MAG: hypothetical protein K9M36_03185 [Candidatus Pacebacteria bacterium]|nr:hypothetical protein [Candidatus Paceibacterota bacterium]